MTLQNLFMLITWNYYHPYFTLSILFIHFYRDPTLCMEILEENKTQFCRSRLDGFVKCSRKFKFLDWDIYMYISALKQKVSKNQFCSSGIHIHKLSIFSNLNDFVKCIELLFGHYIIISDWKYLIR